MATYNGTAGDDIYTGTANTDQIYGKAGNDRLAGGAGNDLIEGGAGDDLIDGGSGYDTLRGGEGIDTATYFGATQGVSVRLLSTSDSSSAFLDGLNADSLRDIENLTGSSFDDKLYGQVGANVIDGGAGDDILASFAASVEVSQSLIPVLDDLGFDVDTLLGGDGNDVLIAGIDDIIDGGAGNDRVTINLASSTSAVLADLTGAFAGSTAAFGAGSLSRVESLGSLVGSRFDDVISIGEADREYRASLPATPGNADPLYTGGVYGGGGDDTITGGSKSNVFHGGLGDDSLAGFGGDDFLVGGDGMDTLLGGDGDDLLIAGSFTFDGTLGNPNAFDLAHVTKHLDTVSGEALRGGAGSDTIIAALGDAVDGGEGFDTLIVDYRVSSAPVAIDEALYAASNTTIVGVERVTFQLSKFDDRFDLISAPGGQFQSDLVNINDVHGGAGDDFIRADSVGLRAFGDVGDDTLIGGSNNDTFDGGDGDDFLDGGAGDDYLVGGWGADVLLGGAGNDYLEDVASYPGGIMIGGTGDDYLKSGNFALMEGGEGDDTLHNTSTDTSPVASYVTAASRVRVDLSITGVAQDTLGAGRDTLLRIYNLAGSSFHDTLIGNAWRNLIGGGAGNDSINGAAGDDSLSGDVGNDTLAGGWGNDELFGDDGDDILNGYSGNDTLDGGLGIDTASYADVGAVAVNLALQAEYGFVGAQNTRSAGLDTLTGIENLTGSAYNDTLAGSVGNNVILAAQGNDIVDGGDGSDTLNGGLGDDEIVGGAGNDKIDGGAGNDLLSGGAGDDVIIGGAGVDTLSYADSAAGVSMNLFYTTAQGTGGEGRDTVTGVENLIGSGFNDTLSGNAGANRLDGGKGNDVLVGGLGNDVLNGGDGNDQLTGGNGSDFLSGGTGADVFRFLALAESTLDPNGQDSILDFSQVQGDRIGLALIDANRNTPADNAFAFVSTFSGVAGQLVSSFDAAAGNYVVSGDVNGDGLADFGFRVFSSSALTAADFLL